MLPPIQTNQPVELRWIESQAAQLKSINQVMAQIIKDNSNKSQEEAQQAVSTQAILSADEAKQWGLVEEIRKNFLDPGANFVTVNLPSPVQHNDSPSIFTGPPAVSAN